jgi:hypothetical protein
MLRCKSFRRPLIVMAAHDLATPPRDRRKDFIFAGVLLPKPMFRLTNIHKETPVPHLALCELPNLLGLGTRQGRLRVGLLDSFQQRTALSDGAFDLPERIPTMQVVFSPKIIESPDSRQHCQVSFVELRHTSSQIIDRNEWGYSTHFNQSLSGCLFQTSDVTQAESVLKKDSHQIKR